MKTVALVSMKGGSGKTTAAVHIAVAAAQQGRNVALLDTDPQQSAARWGDRRAAALPVVLTVPPSRLAAELQRCADAGTDLAIIDTPPRAGSDNAAQAAARVADLVLLPCRPSVLDVEAIADTAARVRAVTAAPVVVVLNACAPRGQDADQVAAALADVGVQVAPVRIGQRIVLARSLLTGQVAQETEPGGRAAQEVAAVHAFIACTLEQREHPNTIRGQHEHHQQLRGRTPGPRARAPPDGRKSPGPPPRRRLRPAGRGAAASRHRGAGRFQHAGAHRTGYRDAVSVARRGRQVGRRSGRRVYASRRFPLTHARLGRESTC